MFTGFQFLRIPEIVYVCECSCVTYFSVFYTSLGDGKIRVATDLRYATSSAYKLKVTATDGYNTINDFVVTVNLNSELRSITVLFPLL